jgi:hypothetical protein
MPAGFLAPVQLAQAASRPVGAATVPTGTIWLCRTFFDSTSRKRRKQFEIVTDRLAFLKQFWCFRV